MEKDNQLREFNHTLNIIERKNISISGVKKIESFDNKEFFIDSVMGYIIIKGEELELIKLDTKDGYVTIKGLLNSINYVDSNTKNNNKDNTFLNRLFK